MREIIILGSGPGAENCPFDREVWAVGKALMGTKPLTRVDKFFMLDDLDQLLSTKVASNKDDYLKELGNLTGLVAGLDGSLDFGPSEFFTKADKIKMSIHDLTTLRQELVHQNRFTKEDFIKKINESEDVPFITCRKHPDVPSSVAYPLKEIVKKFGIPYFTNTIAYMLAYALYEKVDSIQIYGVVQGGYYEYMKERKGVEFWLGIAAGTGIKIEIKGNSELLTNDDNLLYGYKRSPEQLKYEDII
jgi:hypothetical protein